jgi:hypothetical protein
MMNMMVNECGLDGADKAKRDRQKGTFSCSCRVDACTGFCSILTASCCTHSKDETNGQEKYRQKYY